MTRIFGCGLLLMAFSYAAKTQITNSGNMKFFPGANVTFLGDFTNNGTVVDSGTVVSVAGANPQTIGGTSVTIFNNMTIVNTSVSGVTLLQTIHIQGALTMTTGLVNTTATNNLILNNGATTSGANNTSFVSGPLVKIGNQAFVFPVGKNSVYAPISISAPLLTSDEFTATYFQLDPDPFYDVNNKDASLDHISQCEYWTLDRTAGTSDVVVNLSWDTRSCGVDNPSDLRVARWDGLQWKDEGNGGTTGNPISGTIFSGAAVSSFSPFTLSSITGLNPLPIQLVNFEGHCEETSVKLNWTTASEMNNDFFSIERSRDGENWINIANIDGSGNSSVAVNYSYSDFQLQNDISYYRLKQTDLNGESKYSTLISVQGCRENGDDDYFVVYPNPTTGIINTTYGGNNQLVSSIAIFDAMGKRIFYSENYQNTFDLSLEQDGVYFIHLNVGEKILTKRFIIARHT